MRVAIEAVDTGLAGDHIIAADPGDQIAEVARNVREGRIQATEGIANDDVRPSCSDNVIMTQGSKNVVHLPTPDCVSNTTMQMKTDYQS